MLSIIKRALNEIRQQLLIGALSIFSTAFAVFLGMIVMMLDQVKVTPFAPESCRPHLMLGKYMHVSWPEKNNDSSSALSDEYAHRFYDDLDGVELVSYYYESWNGSEAEATYGDITLMLRANLADANFWKIFDHTFLAGRPYSEGASESGVPEVVLSESAARRLLGVQPEEAVGRQIVVGEKEATVVGVVADHTPLASHAYGELFGPMSALAPKWTFSDDPFFGSTSAFLLLKPGVSHEHLKAQVEERYRRLADELKSEGAIPYYHQQPYTLEESAMWLGSNTDPSSDNTDYIIYLMLVLIPAINLSSITNSRLRHRVAEIGVRRAFGATRSRIFTDLLAENFIVTLIGAAAGFILSILVAWATAGVLFHLNDYGPDAVFSPLILINWKIAGFALLIAFVLNILSACLPAVRASRINPVEAIAGGARR